MCKYFTFFKSLESEVRSISALGHTWLKNMFLVFPSDVPKLTSSLTHPHPQLYTFPCGQIAIVGLVKLLTSLVYHAASTVSQYKGIAR